MNKQDLLNAINSTFDACENMQDSFYRGKSFVVVSHRIERTFKTKRGAEGYINRNKGFSYYDDYSQELVYPNRNLEIIEVLESEYKPLSTNKKVWYNWLKDCMGRSYMYDTIGHTAKRILTDNEDLFTYVMESLEDLRNNNGLKVYEEVQEVAAAEKIKEGSITIVTPGEEAQPENNITVEVKFNEEKKGIELYFTDKPSKEILANLKDNGFRWGKFKKCWYSKDSEEKREYLKSLNLLVEGEEKTITSIEEMKEIEYPTIDINDIESYNISQNIIDMENNNSMFRKEDTDHNTRIKSHLESYNIEVTEALEGNKDKQLEYYSLRWLQGYKKKYFNLYVKMLTHKAYNPSWMVTGRGGMNIARYNKKQEQYSKMVEQMAALQDEYKEKISSIKYKVKKQIKGLQEAEIKEILSNVDVKISLEKKKVKINPSAVNYIFEGGTIEKNVNYLNGYYALKNWGCWRVYNEAGKELYSTKTTGKLEEVKRWILAAAQKDIAI